MWLRSDDLLFGVVSEREARLMSFQTSSMVLWGVWREKGCCEKGEGDDEDQDELVDEEATLFGVLVLLLLVVL